MLRVVSAAGQGVFQQSFEGNFAQCAACLGPAKDCLQRLRGLRHVAPRLLHLAKLRAHFPDGLAGSLQLLGHGDLRVAREFARGSHSGLQFLADLSKLGRHRLHQVVD